MTDSGALYDKCRSYVTSQLAVADEHGRRLPQTPSQPTVTISRLAGAGAVVLAERLADYLNEHDTKAKVPWTLFDKNLVEKILEDHHLPKEIERYMPEDKPHPIEEAFSEILGLRPSDWTLFEHSRDTIYRLALLGNVILVGRGANIIARGLPNVLSLRLIASPEHRVARCREMFGHSDAQAREFIRKEDRARRRYVRAYFDKDTENPLNYHMVMNLDLVSDDHFVRTVGDCVLNWPD